jgi:hypothetical protein
MTNRDTKLLVGLGRLGMVGTAVACVPTVPATVVIDETRPPDHQQPRIEAEQAEGTGIDHTPPQVVRAELVGSSGVLIRFSEPISAAEGFDPADFRISYFRAYLQRQGAIYNAYYYDPAYFHSGEFSQPFAMTNARVDSDTLELGFAPALSPEQCRELEYIEEYNPPGIESDEGLFLHYAAGSIPIRDASGNALANFGADWVVRGREQTRLEITGDAAKRAWSTLVRLACGPPIPPGPR